MPPNLLNTDSVGTTFQLNVNETHHALRCSGLVLQPVTTCKLLGGMHASVSACMPCMMDQHVVWVQRRVLRLREGDSLEVCDGMGTIAEGRFAGLTHNNRAFVETTGDIRQVLLRYSSLHGQSAYNSRIAASLQHAPKSMHLFGTVAWEKGERSHSV